MQSREAVTVQHLKLVDLLKTGDALEFTYKGRVFTAAVSRCGCIADADTAEERGKGCEYVHGAFHYKAPSNWTRDCIDRKSVV